MIFVMSAHLIGAGVNPMGVFSCFMWQNAAVAVFFFMSGYGHMSALKNRPEYIHGMIGRTVRKLGVPVLLVLLLAVMANVVSGDLEMARLLSFCKKGELVLVPHIWYAVVYFMLSIAFSMLARWLKGVCLLLSVFFIVVCLGALFKCGFHWPRWWWLSLHAYPIGMSYRYFEDKIRSVMVKQYATVGAFFLAVCVLNGVLGCNAMEGFMRGLIGPIVVMGFYVLPIPQSSKIFSFLGVISFELYLCHGVVRVWMLKMATEEWRTSVGLASIFVAVVVAWLFHKIVELMNIRRCRLV